MSMIETTDMEKRIAERVDPRAAQMMELSKEAGGIGFTSMAQAMEFAKMMAVSSIAIPKHLRGNVGACMAVTIQAVEWKCSPFAVANKSYSVNDRLAYESQLVQAVILQRAPIKGRFQVEYIGSGDKRQCKVTATLKEGGTVDYTSPEISKIPVKNSPLWKGDPDQQLFYYSGRALCRRHFPDVLLGIYTPEEIAAEMQSQGPDNARDVTPARTLTGRLDALAGETIDETAGEPDAPADDAGEAATSGASSAVESGSGADAPDATGAETGDARSTDAASAPVDETHPEVFAEGRDAARAGKSRKNPPIAYRNDDRLDAWHRGYDSVTGVDA